MINKINTLSTGISCSGKKIDEEHLRIIQRLQKYGITPTLNKAVDKAILHRKELEEAEKENCITNKFLLVTKKEQEKIQEKKKNKKMENNPELEQETMKGQKLLGEQIMLAINMKKRLDKTNSL